MIRLRGNPDFSIFKEVVQGYVDENVAQLIKTEGNQMYRSQGAVIALTAVIHEFESAPETAMKYQGKK